MPFQSIETQLVYCVSGCSNSVRLLFSAGVCLDMMHKKLPTDGSHSICRQFARDLPRLVDDRS